MVTLVTAAALLCAGSAAFAGVRVRRNWALCALFPVGDAVLLTVFVFSEDTYREHGISRWDAYRSPGGALGPMFVASVVSLAICGAALVWSALPPAPRVFGACAVVGGSVALLLVSATIAGFSLN